MNVRLVITSILALLIDVVTGTNNCPDHDTKHLLKQYRVDKELTPLLNGNSYVGIWANKRTTDMLDCWTTEFIEENKKLKGNLHNVKHDGSHVSIPSYWTENKGHSSFTSTWAIVIPRQGELRFNEFVHTFYAEEFVLGYFSCETSRPGLQKIAISVRKGMESDEEALKSIRNAEDIMEKLKVLVPDTVTKFTREQCPMEV